MKLSFLSTALPLAFNVARTSAYIAVDPLPDVLAIGNTYTVSWAASENYFLNITLVADEVNGTMHNWSNEQQLVTGAQTSANGTGSFAWKVGSNVTLNTHYALWFGALGDDAVVDSNITSLFTFSGTPSSGNGTNPSSSGADHAGLSGGAIGGIVIGVLAAVVVVGAAVVLSLRRHRRSDQHSSEAAARAGRLAAVMPKSYSAFEMTQRPTAANKEMNL